jgi:hypothetical protein
MILFGRLKEKLDQERSVLCFEVKGGKIDLERFLVV